MCRDRTLIGQRLAVYWGGDQSWYNGRVVECRHGKEFKIVYDDGEMSWESVFVELTRAPHFGLAPAGRTVLEQEMFCLIRFL